MCVNCTKEPLAYVLSTFNGIIYCRVGGRGSRGINYWDRYFMSICQCNVK